MSTDLMLNPTKLPKEALERANAEKSINTISDILASFDYKGSWEIRFIKPTSKKGEVFKATNQDGIKIYCKLKLGKKENMWETAITPPSEYLVSEVFDNFRRVHPVSLSIEPKVAEIDHKKFLHLDSSNHYNGLSDEYALERGLIVCGVFATKERSGNIKDAQKAISKELNLKEWSIAQNFKEETACNIIVMNLCSAALMVTDRAAKENYVLGPPALEKLAKIDMPEEIRAKLFSKTQDTVPEIPEIPETLSQISVEYEKLKKQKEETDEVAKDLKEKIDEHPPLVDLEKKIHKTQVLIEKKKKELEELEKQKEITLSATSEVQKEYDYVLEEQSKIGIRLAERKKKIQSML